MSTPASILFECPQCRGMHFNVAEDGTLVCTSHYHGAVGCGWKGRMLEGPPKSELGTFPAFPQSPIVHPDRPGVIDWPGAYGPVAGMSLHQYYVGEAMGSLHGQIADIFVTGLVPPDRQSEEETRAYYEKRVKQIAKTCCDIADATIAELEARQS